MTIRALFASAAFVLASTLAQAAPFTPGNVVVYRIGNGVAALSANGNPVFLDEYTPAGALVQSLALPSAGSGANVALVASGTATSDGHLTRSTNGSCLVVPGYGRDLATGAGNLVSGTLAGGGAIPRVFGRVDANGAINTSTALTDAAVASNPRGAASVDCVGMWVSGGAGGVRYAVLGATSSTDLTSGTFANLRVAGIFGNQLYASLSVTALRGVATIGTGLPTTGPVTVTKFTGLTDTNSPNTYAFFLADLDAGVAGMDTLYIADEGAGALSKFSLVGGTWTSNGTIGVDSDDYRGLTASVSGTTVTLYATRRSGTTAELVKLVDASGYNGAFAGTPTVLASAAANTTFRGVALAPELTVTPSADAHSTISPNVPQVVAPGATPSFTVSADPGYTLLVGGTCGGTLVGNTYTTNAVVANCTVNVTTTLQVTHVVTPSADAHSAINPSTPQTVIEGETKAFTVAADPGYVLDVGGTCGGSLVGATYTTNAIVGDCSVAVTSTLVTFTVTPSAGSNGTIAPSIAQSIAQGLQATFTVTPDAGFSAVVGGTCGGLLSGTTYTTNPVTADCTVIASFVPLPMYAVTPSAGPHGSITPAIAQSVVSGQSTSFTVTPDAGYKVVVRGTCGGTLAGNTYTTNPITADCTVTASFATKLVLFVGNSYTFGRVDPVMSYNTANVTDLTYQMWLTNPTGSNVDEPHPWGGIPGVFKKFLQQKGIEWDVSISARNAASLRGHYLNSNPAGWDLRGNVAAQSWDAVVLQDLSDEPLPAGRGANANLPYFNAYADKLEAWIHAGGAETYTESQLYGGSTSACMAITGATAGACDTVRVISPANLRANAATDVYLYQTWARPDMIAPNGTNVNGPFYSALEGLEAMTQDLHNAYFGRAIANANYKAVNPVGDAFLRAVTEGIAMRDPYVPEPGKINLWHTDYFHPSKQGSYLSALVHFAMITGIDPTTLGAGEQAAIDLGIAVDDATDLQLIAKVAVLPAAPSISSVTSGDGEVTVTFTPATAIGTLPVISYTATCGMQSATASGSPIVVAGLANGVAVTCTVSASNSVGSGSASAVSASVTPAAAAAAPSDLNGDGKSDLLWSNTADGSMQGWLMDGTTATQIAGLLPAGGYSVTHTADLDGDGKADLLIRHTDGTVIGWLMNGLGVAGSATLLPAGSGWSVVKTGDLNGDGKADLIVQHTDGTVVAWIMNGLSVSSVATFVPAGSGWSVSKVADLNGDGKADLLWQHTDGTVQAWLMDGTTATQVATFVGAGTGWSVARTGDLNGDGKADLLWQNIDGSTQAWIMDGLNVTSLASFTPAGTGWSPVLTGDISGDGKADIFWEHTSGASQTWLMDGTTATSLATFVPAGTGWTASHLLDLSGDGKQDVLWKHTSGAVQAWLMNGLTITQLATLAGAGTYQVTPPAP